jgi:RraA family protein
MTEPTAVAAIASAPAPVQKPKTAEMNPGPGFRIRRNEIRPERALLAGFEPFTTPDISDIMNRLYTMVPEIRQQTDPDTMLLGPACTVKVFPGDNLMVHKALDLVQPGDIMMIDAGASPMNAVLGDLITTKARHRGVAGIVVDGLIRDIEGILETGVPVFARGVTPIGPLHRGPGEINYPIQCGGIVVHPGDVVIGDRNGVVIVPLEAAESVLQQLRTRRQGEAAYLAAVQRGEFSNGWVDKLLVEAQCNSV